MVQFDAEFDAMVARVVERAKAAGMAEACEVETRIGLCRLALSPGLGRYRTLLEVERDGNAAAHGSSGWRDREVAQPGERMSGVRYRCACGHVWQTESIALRW